MSDTTIQAADAGTLSGKAGQKEMVVARRKQPRVNRSAIVMGLYLLFLLLPIYWLVNMSFKTNEEILSTALTRLPITTIFMNSPPTSKVLPDWQLISTRNLGL